MISRYISELGRGALIYSYFFILAALSLMFMRLPISYYGIPFGVFTLAIGFFLSIYGLIIMKNASEALERYISDVRGLSNSFTVLIFVTILAALMTATAALSGSDYIPLSLILLMFAYLYAGYKLVYIAAYGFGAFLPVVLILLGGFTLPLGYTAILVRLGFYLLGKTRSKVEISDEFRIQKIKLKLEEELENNEAVDLREFAKKYGYSMMEVVDAAAMLVEEQKMLIENFRLVKS